MANNRRRLVGTVVSDKMQKTVVVEIERRKMHPVYKKVVRTTKRVMAHDESDAIPVGTVVQVVESRPLSRKKRWVVEAVITGEANQGQPVPSAAEIAVEQPDAGNEEA
jgi:small subunit ribosomal protein S17